MNIDLSGKRAIVCGSSQGIGAAIASEFAKCGASVTLVARRLAQLKEVVSRLDQEDDGRHHCLSIDLADTEAVRQQVEEYCRTVEAVHILVNNTGGPPPGTALMAREDDFMRAFSGHLLAHHIFVRACVPLMRKAQYGRIINIISTSVKQPIPGLGVSNTIRGAVANWAKTLAGELAMDGITVNNILPGFVDTERLQAIIASRAEKEGKTAQLVAQEMRQSVPLQRFADPSEVAAAVAFLAAPAAGYINGINLPVDGGRTLSL